MNEDEVISEEELRALLYNGTANATLARALEQQQKQAEMMRSGAGAPEGQMVSGHYVPPHLLQYAGNLAKQYSASRMDKNAVDTGREMDQNTNAQNQAVLAAILRGQGRQTPPATPFQPPPVMGQPGY